MTHPIDFTIRMEGGFVNDPRDPGGATKYGISLRFLKLLDPTAADLDGDGDVDVNDIFEMTEVQARRLYMEKFYGPLEVWRFAFPVGSILLDTAVNLGRKRAVLILQRALNAIGAGLVEDGILGPDTIGAEDAVKDRDQLARFMILDRIFEYVSLCESRPDLKRFFFGWIRRCRELRRFALEEGV